ncbi:uncharacterized protein LOC129600409 [Paramacrobiotus metropolitanus]|uniref:uncharacterized protein LOC129600409 n=1 Tax=Paramacrobiotus metropolitanus TaxID=2943436 RepID=UPI002445EFBA|nr:uncharacterized protein LOC129600409 [Paramacrobiotus metropolitanus]
MRVSVLSLFLAIGSCYSQCPNVPINPPGQPIRVEATAGIWYEYHFRNGPDPATDESGQNVVMNVTVRDALPGGRQPSYVVTRYYMFLSDSDPKKAECASINQLGNWTADGVRQTLSDFGDGTIENVTYINLFTDYNLLQILYRCQTKNADGKRCDLPYMWINTRVPPPQLKDYQKQYIEAASNYYLGQVCRKFSDTSATPYDVTLTNNCNVDQGKPAPSANFAVELKKFGIK